MKRFHFPLRPVAVLRAHRELLAREAFASAVHAFAQSRERLTAARARVSGMEELLLESCNGRLMAADAVTLLRVYRAERQGEAEAERAMIEQRNAMWQRRGDYIEANRRLKIVSRLEEQARGRHRLEQARAEQNALDEFAGFGARRPALS